MLENVKAVIFDLDGTMADSMWVWTSVDRDYIDQYKLDIPQGFYEEIEGMSFTETAQHFLDVFPQITLSLDEIKEAWIKMAEEKYRNEVSLRHGIREFLEDLKQRGIRIGMATSNSRVLAEGLLKSNGIREYFDEDLDILRCESRETSAGCIPESGGRTSCRATRMSCV